MAAILAANLGRLEEAIALIQRAAVLDPLSVPTHKFVGLFALSAGRLEEAAIALKTAIELNPQAGFNHLWLGVVRLTQGRLDEALGAVEQEVHSSMRLLGLALVQYSRRWLEESEATLWNLIEQDAAGSAYQIAQAYAYRGEVNDAFEWLERAYVQHDPGATEVRWDILLRNLHGDPRWPPFLKKMGLAD
jgi:adenylate cyclase